MGLFNFGKKKQGEEKKSVSIKATEEPVYDTSKVGEELTAEEVKECRTVLEQLESSQKEDQEELVKLKESIPLSKDDLKTEKFNKDREEGDEMDKAFLDGALEMVLGLGRAAVQKLENRINERQKRINIWKDIVSKMDTGVKVKIADIKEELNDLKLDSDIQVLAAMVNAAKVIANEPELFNESHFTKIRTAIQSVMQEVFTNTNK
jgi:hypothetical protein